MKNTGYIRVDVKGQMLDMQINIKDTELDYTKGSIYMIRKTEQIDRVPLVDILMKDGVFYGKTSYNCVKSNGEAFGFETIIGIVIEYENGVYMASCWKEGEEKTIASRACGGYDEAEENMKAASVDFIEDFENEIEPSYKKINLNEIYTLPSHAWHFSNNSFVLHGFWNYGYLVLKETMEEKQKRIALGVPGIFEQPEMVMAMYFGFPKFETLSSKVIELNMGERCMYLPKAEKQPEVGSLGCWFVNL